MKMQVITTKATIKKEVRKTLREIDGFNKNVQVYIMSDESLVTPNTYDYDLTLDVCDGHDVINTFTYKGTFSLKPSHMIDDEFKKDLMDELWSFGGWASDNFSCYVHVETEIVSAQYVVKKRRIHAFSDSAYYKVCTKTKTERIDCYDEY